MTCYPTQLHYPGTERTRTMTCYLTQLHYPGTEPTSPCPILIMPSARLGSDKYQFKSHWFDSTRFRSSNLRIPQSPKTGGRCSTHSATTTGPQFMARVGVRAELIAILLTLLHLSFLFQTLPIFKLLRLLYYGVNRLTRITSDCKYLSGYMIKAFINNQTHK